MKNLSIAMLDVNTLQGETSEGVHFSYLHYATT